MKIKFLIPVTADYTQRKQDLLHYLKPLLSADTELVFCQISEGFSSVENEMQGMFNGCQVVENVRKEEIPFDGVYINCFDDPGVYACRELGTVPVIGPYQPSIHTAMTLAERIGIITTDADGILSEERKARLLGIRGRIAAIRPVQFPVSDIRKEKEQLTQRLFEICCSMVKEHRVTAVCLGCTAMFYVAEDLRSRLAEAGVYVNIIEPVANALLFLEHIIRLGYQNKIK